MAAIATDSMNGALSTEPQLIVDLDGYEGPLDLLLELARRQKVDLRKISILRLAEQYAAFIDNARALRINLAADYLVMAAWLALIKSRLLLPKEANDDESEDVVASRLAERLRRLNAMRQASQSLMERRQLGQDFFARGEPEPLSVRRITRISANAFDLTQAYARLRIRNESQPLRVKPTPVLSVEAAMSNLQRLLGEMPDWIELLRFLPEGWTEDGRKLRSALASTFVASLELARQGRLDMHQSHAFGTLRVRTSEPSNE